MKQERKNLFFKKAKKHLGLIRERINNNLTQKEVARRLGLKRIWSYQRLENSITNPSLETIYKIKNVFPNFQFEFVF